VGGLADLGFPTQAIKVAFVNWIGLRGFGTCEQNTPQPQTILIPSGGHVHVLAAGAVATLIHLLAEEILKNASLLTMSFH